MGSDQQLILLVPDLVIEFYLNQRGFGKFRDHGQEVIVGCRLPEMHLDGNYWQHDPVFFHLLVGKSEGAQPLNPTHLKVLSIVAVIDHTHLVRFSISYPKRKSVLIPHLSVKNPIFKDE